MKTQPKRVLLIEDNPGDVELVRLLFEGSSGEPPYEVSCADRLSTGLEALAEERPAVILLDLYLPDSKGADTFRNVLNQAPGVPVVILTGRDDEELVVDAVQHGVQDYLVKGAFDGKQLGRALRCAIERQALVTALGTTKAEQLRFKERFLSRVSAKLRTPLTVISEFVTTVLGDLAAPLTKGEREHLDTVLSGIRGMLSLIDNQLEEMWVESSRLGFEPLLPRECKPSIRNAN